MCFFNASILSRWLATLENVALDLCPFAHTVGLLWEVMWPRLVIKSWFIWWQTEVSLYSPLSAKLYYIVWLSLLTPFLNLGKWSCGLKVNVECCYFPCFVTLTFKVKISFDLFGTSLLSEVLVVFYAPFWDWKWSSICLYVLFVCKFHWIEGCSVVLRQLLPYENSSLQYTSFNKKIYMYTKNTASFW